MKARITIIGSSNTDMVIKLDRIPLPGETLLGGKFVMAPGGKGANQAVAAARAGGNVCFVARVGNDLFGERTLQNLKEDKIDVRHVFRDPVAPSGVALIFVARTGENSIAVASGANAHLSPANIFRAKGAVKTSSLVLMQLETPLKTVEAAVKLASLSGVRVILNPAPAARLSNTILKRVSILTPNETEAQLLTGVHIDSQATADKAARKTALARGGYGGIDPRRKGLLRLCSRLSLARAGF
jgi:ribokinase